MANGQWLKAKNGALRPIFLVRQLILFRAEAWK